MLCYIVTLVALKTISVGFIIWGFVRMLHKCCTWDLVRMLHTCRHLNKLYGLSTLPRGLCESQPTDPVPVWGPYRAVHREESLGRAPPKKVRPPRCLPLALFLGVRV